MFWFIATSRSTCLPPKPITQEVPSGIHGQQQHLCYVFFSACVWVKWLNLSQGLTVLHLDFFESFFISFFGTDKDMIYSDLVVNNSQVLFLVLDTSMILCIFFFLFVCLLHCFKFKDRWTYSKSQMVFSVSVQVKIWTVRDPFNREKPSGWFLYSTM